jgi:hypothetical protein
MLSLSASDAFATLFTYDVTNGEFNDGGTLTGTVTFDTAMSDAIVAYKLTTSSGSLMGGYQYTSSGSPVEYGSYGGYLHYSFSSAPEIPGSPLNISGEPVDLDLSITPSNLGEITSGAASVALATPYNYITAFGQPLTSGECYNCYPFRVLDPGVTLSLGNAVPEPAAWALMLIGLAGIGATLRGSRRRPGFATV